MRRLSAETGVHLPGLWPDDMFPVPDATTAEPSLAAALARGVAWARDELGDHLAALLDEPAGGAGPATGYPVGA